MLSPKLLQKEERSNAQNVSCDLIKCTDCGKEFDKRADLLLHTRDVHSENKFPCPLCDKVFKQRRNMNRHHNKCKLK